MGQAEPDPPTNRDWTRMRSARARARSFAAEIAERRDLALLRVFREEIGATVRSVSPFLVSILRVEDRSVDDVVAGISPAGGWPRRPRLRNPLAGPGGVAKHALRYYVAGMAGGGGVAASLTDDCHFYDFTLYGGGLARVKVVGHSLEVAVVLGAVRLETRFGILRVRLDRRMPETLATACVGRPVEAVVDHVALRGRGWRITGIEEPRYALDGQVVCVATGSVSYRLPWARDDGLT